MIEFIAESLLRILRYLCCIQSQTYPSYDSYLFASKHYFSSVRVWRNFRETDSATVLCLNFLLNKRRSCLRLLDPDVTSGEAARPSAIHPAEFLLFTFAIHALPDIFISSKPGPFLSEQNHWTLNIYRPIEFYCRIITLAPLEFTDFLSSSPHSLVNTSPPSPTRAPTLTTQNIKFLPPSHLFPISSITIRQSVLITGTCILVSQLIIRLPFEYILWQLLTSPSTSKVALLQCKPCFSHIF